MHPSSTTSSFYSPAPSTTYNLKTPNSHFQSVKIKSVRRSSARPATFALASLRKSLFWASDGTASFSSPKSLTN